VHVSRREFLTGALGLVATGCAVNSGSSSDPQTVVPETVAVSGQPLDPWLRLSLPDGAIDLDTITQFEHDTGVKVRPVAQESDASLLLDLAAGREGKLDVALVQAATVPYLISQGLAEPIDRALVPNLQWLSAPFNDPPYDPRSGHSIGKDYTVIGYVSSSPDQVTPGASWRGFFRLARDVPGSVAVPDDSEAVVGAALLATGHSWSSTSSSDLEDAHRLLAGLRKSLVVEGKLDRTKLSRHRLAALCTGYGFRFRNSGSGTTFVVPEEGTVIRMRSYCILSLAPDPVSAHAWLNATLDPFVASQDVVATRLASTVGQADYLLSQAILSDPAIYPPATLDDRLHFASATGADTRATLWQDVRP
jgi:spermidine/putrescine-binding protein